MTLFDREVDQTWERRLDRRYECRLPLRYRSGQERDGAAGTVTDISRGGIAVQIPHTLTQGSCVELWVDWPSVSDQVSSKVSLMILGQVIRSDSRRTAIAIERRQFVKNRFSATPA